MCSKEGGNRKQMVKWYHDALLAQKQEKIMKALIYSFSAKWKQNKTKKSKQKTST